MENGVYEDRRNPNEAAYIAQLVRGLLQRETRLEHRHGGLLRGAAGARSKSALSRLADEDSDFAAQLEAEYVREENDEFCGLFVKNLENVQGDERDIIIMSVCYGHDAERPDAHELRPDQPARRRKAAERHLLPRQASHGVVSSIRHHDITNDYNDGANSLKNFLQYAEAVSKGDASRGAARSGESESARAAKRSRR